jgi:hypothetical protein
MTSHSRSRCCPALLVLALFASACFETPVDESVQLRFLPNGAVVVTSTVAVMDETQSETNPALSRRLSEARQALFEGSDAWSRRFAGVQPVTERSSWEKILGVFRKSVHSAVLAEPKDFTALFGDTSLIVSYDIQDDGIAELVITPGPPAAATQRQRQEVERILDIWTESVARYLAAGGELYQYLDEHPERARACLGALFADQISETDREKLPALNAQEKELNDRLQAAMQEVWSVLTIPEGEDHTPDELSHLVYDPFPGRLTVRLPGAPLEAPEGFIIGKDGALSAAGPGLWQALRSLEGRWLSPDPLLLYMERVRRSPDEPFDLSALLRQERRAEAAPGTKEVRLAIEERLRPAPVYRVPWKIDPDALGSFQWEPGEG